MSKLLFFCYHWLWKGLDLLYPPSCAGCGNHGSRWCENCQDQVVLISEHVCEICGRTLNNGARNINNICPACKKKRPSFFALRSWALFEDPLRQALHSLKYTNNIGLGEIFSHYLAHLWKGMAWSVDVIIPVPLSGKRQAQRGYNQAALLAQPLAIDRNINYQPGALWRIRETSSQVGLNREQRQQNVSGAFKAQSRYIVNKSILLVDDIATTGATLNACSSALLEEGAKRVFCLTLARAQFS